MKVLHLISNLEIGGGPSSAVLTANELSVSGGIEVHLGSRLGPLANRLTDSVCFHELRAANHWSSLTELSSLARETSPDLIHVHGSRMSVNTWLALRMAKLRVPIISTRHSQGFRFVPDRFAVSLLKRIVKHTVALSPAESAALIAKGMPTSTVSVIPHPIDVSKFSNVSTVGYPTGISGLLHELQGGDTEHVTVCVGARLVKGKGLEDFVRSISILGEKKIRVTGVIAGEGPLRKKLESMASEVQHPAAIEFTGFQPDITNVLARADFALFLSEAEVLPMFLIEAMATGLPVVARRISATEHLIRDGESGILVDGPEEAALAIIQLLEAPKKASAIRRAAKVRIERFSAASTTRKLRQLYVNVLSQIGAEQAN